MPTNNPSDRYRERAREVTRENQRSNPSADRNRRIRHPRGAVVNTASRTSPGVQVMFPTTAVVGQPLPETITYSLGSAFYFNTSNPVVQEVLNFPPTPEQLEADSVLRNCTYCSEQYGSHGGVTYQWAQCGVCNRCCEHADCEVCKKHVSRNKFCTECRSCRDCCECIICNAPLISIGRANKCVNVHNCSKCYGCKSHCHCVKSIEESYGYPWKAGAKDLKSFDCDRLVGVEWEYNKVKNSTPLIKWKDDYRGHIHNDGSCGKEIVTSPMAGDHIVKSLSAIGDIFKSAKAEADTRCGIHVHVDARDFAWSDIFRMLTVYAFVEPIMYVLAGQERSKNRYCMPCGQEYLDALKKEDQKGAVLAVALGVDLNSSRKGMRQTQSKKGGGRYRGLNIMPWVSGRKKKAPDTTVEFRIHANSLDPNRVIEWTKIYARLVDWSIKSTNKNVKDLPKSAIRALCEIAPDSKEWIIKELKAWRIRNKASEKKRLIHSEKGVYKLGKKSIFWDSVMDPVVTINTRA